MTPMAERKTAGKENKKLKGFIVPSNEQHSAESVPHSLCSAFGMIGSQMTSHQSLVRPLPSADIAEHRASYTSALLGLCLQSAQGGEKGGGL